MVPKFQKYNLYTNSYNGLSPKLTEENLFLLIEEHNLLSRMDNEFFALSSLNIESLSISQYYN